MEYFWPAVALLGAAFNAWIAYDQQKIGAGILALLFMTSFVFSVYNSKQEPQQSSISQVISEPESQQGTWVDPNGIPPANFVEAMGRDPVETGGECYTYETGESCTWDETPYFVSAEAARRSFEDYTVNIRDPKFPESKLPEGYLDGPSGLEGGYANYTIANSGEIQISVQSAKARERLGY